MLGASTGATSARMSTGTTHTTRFATTGTRGDRVTLTRIRSGGDPSTAWNTGKEPRYLGR